MPALVPRCARDLAGRGNSDARGASEVQFGMALLAQLGVFWNFHAHALQPFHYFLPLVFLLFLFCLHGWTDFQHDPDCFEQRRKQ